MSHVDYDGGPDGNAGTPNGDAQNGKKRRKKKITVQCLQAMKDRGQPITMAAETLRMGAIIGATSIAPMTTAVESATTPSVAMAVERDIMSTKRWRKARRREPSWKSR